MSTHTICISCTRASAVDQFSSAIEEGIKMLVLIYLKVKQREAVVSFFKGNDTVVALPTGYAKSIIYTVLPHNSTSSEVHDFVARTINAFYSLIWPTLTHSIVANRFFKLLLFAFLLEKLFLAALCE